MPASLAVLVEKIRCRAYQVTDRDVADALAAGWTESHLFELAVVDRDFARPARLLLGVIRRLAGAEPPDVI